MNEIFERVKAIVADELGHDEDDIKVKSGLFDDLGADSLDGVNLMMAFEEEFDVEISEEDARSLKTVGDIVDYIEKQIA